MGASNPPEPAPQQRPLSAVVTAVASLGIPSWIFTFFTTETGFIVASGVLLILALLLLLIHYFVPFLFTRTSSILGADAQPIRIPFFRSWQIALAWASIVVVPTGIWSWFEYGSRFFPTVTIVRFEQSRLVYNTKGHALVPIPLQFVLPDGSEIGATRAVSLTIARPSGFRGMAIRLESISLTVENVQARKKPELTGLGHKNIVFPHRFVAELSQTKRRAECQLHSDDGELSEGVVVIDAENPFAEIHIEVTGREDGLSLYSVTCTVTVTEETGRRRMSLTTKEKAFVYVRNEQPK